MRSWLELLFMGATALATAVTAIVVWRQWRGHVQVEWKWAWLDLYGRSMPPSLELQITIRNSKPFGIAGRKIEVISFPVLDLTVGDRNQRKHASWKPHESPLSLEIEPGESKSTAAFISLDWASLAKRRSVRWRPKSSTALRIQVSIASRARRRWMTKARTKIDIPNATIAKAAAVAKR
jgi:hypothetical protein